FVREKLLQHGAWNSQIDDAMVAIHLRRDGRVQRKPDAEFFSEGLHTRIIEHILAHQRNRNPDAEALSFQKTNGFDRPAERAGNLRDQIVNFGTVRVDADLDVLHAEFLDALGSLFTDQNSVRLQLHREQERPRVLNDFEEVGPEHDLSAADREMERAGFG